MKKEINVNWGKSRCCKAKVDYSGGGYDGEDIVPVVSRCQKCGNQNPSVFQRVGRPVKDIPF